MLAQLARRAMRKKIPGLQMACDAGSPPRTARLARLGDGQWQIPELGGDYARANYYDRCDGRNHEHLVRRHQQALAASATRSQ